MLLCSKQFAALVGLCLCCAISVCAQQRSSAAKGVNRLAAPVPTPLLNGKRAFVSYELGDVTAFPSAYSGGPERAYSEFFTQMRAWGRYELVMDPSEADVVFAIRFVDSPGLPLPQIRVGISDGKTGVALWGFVEQIDPAFFKKHRDASFTESVQLLVGDVQALVAPGAQSSTGTVTPGKTRFSDRAR
ncbi:MAG: hypothetical protein ABSD67_11865 [Terracidiphilus sp.]|jgi:hypothetical protein